MGNKRFLTIQWFQDGASKTHTIRVGYGVLRLLLLCLVLTIITLAVAVIYWSRVAALAYRSRELKQENQAFQASGRKLDSLESILADLEGKARAVENIVHTFVDDRPDGQVDDERNMEKTLISQNSLFSYISRLDSMRLELGTADGASEDYFPGIWPVIGIVSQDFQELHQGIDIITRENSLIVSPAKGVVIQAGWHRDLGKRIEIEHGGQYRTVYGHLNRIFINIGDHVSRGKPIGTLGNTGNSSGPHLHYEIRYAGESVNPMNFLTH